MSREVDILRFTFAGRRFAALVDDLDASELPESLTAAERSIAYLIRVGASNREIASARGSSPRTVANQVASLMRKVGAGSRVELTLRLSAAHSVVSRAAK